MTSNDTSYRCEECDITFSNEKDFLEPKYYVKFRRDGISLAIVMVTTLVLYLKIWYKSNSISNTSVVM